MALTTRPSVDEATAATDAAIDVVPPVRRRRRSIAFGFAVFWLALVAFCGVFADLLPLRGYEAQDYSALKVRPGIRWHEPLGTDQLGRSLLSRVIYGVRVSVVIALLAVFVAMFVGAVIGVCAGYFRGRVEAVTDLVLDTILAVPPLLFLLVISSLFEPSLRSLTASLVFLAIPGIARVVRANTLTFAHREFVTAALAAGARKTRVLFREIMPNVILPAMSVAFLSISGLIVAEGSLSFLGRGVPAPTPSLGGMIASARNSLETDPHLVFVPAAVVLLTVFALNVVSDRVRARLGSRVRG